MANKFTRVEAVFVEGTPETPWHVVIRDQDDDLIPLAGFAEEKVARDYSAKLDRIIVTMQEINQQPDWTNILVCIHDKLGPDLL